MAHHQFEPTHFHVAIGSHEPVMRIKSGDTVSVQTMTTSNPTSLARAGVKDEDIQPELIEDPIHIPPKRPGVASAHIL